MDLEMAVVNRESQDVSKHGPSPSPNVDDDGRPQRTGTMWTASAHIVTAVIGSGVLSLPWAMSQLGWAAGPSALLAFSFITYFNSTFLADSYRSPHPLTGSRNYTYVEVVRSNLGGFYNWLCGLCQYTNLCGTAIGYTITSAISMAAIKRSNCFHTHGKNAPCHTSNNLYMIIFGAFQIVLCQVPDLHNLSWLSALAAVMSFSYSSIGVFLAIAKVISDGGLRGTLAGVEIGVVTRPQKVWGVFQALGNIAFSYSFSMVLIEIQDTLRSKPAENGVMKKATLCGTVITTTYYMLCGVFGYGAFGDKAPGNLLTGFGFYDPYWLIDFANVCIVIHLLGAYQVFVQPVLWSVESQCPDSWKGEYELFGGRFKLKMFRLLWRTLFVLVTTLIAMMLPFFNAILGLLGAIAFWPLTVFFPVQMHLSRNKIPPFTRKWILYQIMSFLCLLVSLAAACGSIAGIINELSIFEPFTSVS